MANQSKLKIGSRDSVLCLICQIESGQRVTFARSENVGRHLRRKHRRFLEIRCRDENTTLDKAVADTVREHVYKQPIPVQLVEKLKRTLVTSFITVTKVPKTTTVKDASNVSNDAHSKGSSPVCENVTEVSSSDNALENPCVSQDLHLSEVVRCPDNTDCPEEKSDQGSEDALPNECMHHPEIIVKKLKEKTKSWQTHFEAECQACKRMKDNKEVCARIFKELAEKAIKNNCSCSVKECCCQRYLEMCLSFLGDSETDTANANPDKDNIDSHFCVIRVNGEPRWFCVLCKEYSSTIGKHLKSRNDWNFNGFSAKNNSSLRMAKAYHLGSKQHKVSIQRSEFAQSQKQPDAFSMKNISAAKATENLRLSAQFFTNHYLSANFFDSFCFYLHSIIKNASEDTNQFSSPLGNRHLTKHGYKAAQIACFDAISEKIKQELENTFAPTGAQRKLMISADKGTANKDVTRQAIVCTYVNNDGIPEEALISVAGITDQTATGAAEQLTKECSRLINTKNVIAMCTDGASVYTGVDRGMVEQLRQKNNFSKKLIFLPDFCHKAERLLCKDKPNWVRETISMSTFIVTSA